MLLRQQIALVLWWAIAIGLLVRAIPRADPPRDLALPFVALAALGVWTAASFAWTDSAERTYLELTRVGHYLALLALIPLVAGRRGWRPALGGLTAGVLAICAVALLSRTAPGVFPPDPAREFFHSDRLSTPFGYWNALGAWAAIAVTMAVAWSVHTRPGALRGLALAAVPIAGATLYLTYSRGALIACAAGLITVIALSVDRRRAAGNAAGGLAATAAVVLVIRGAPEIASGSGGEGGAAVLVAVAVAAGACAALARRRRRTRASARLGLGVPRRIALPAIAAVLAVVVAYGPEAASGVRESFATRAAEAGGDPAERLTTFAGQRQRLWGSAIDAFAENPAGGLGAGTFEFWWSRNGDDPRLVRDAHSLYLETAAELGLVGLAILLVFAGGLARSAMRTWRSRRSSRGAGAAAAAAGAFAAFLVSAAADWMWELTAVAALAIGAVTLAACARSRKRRRLGARARWVAAVLALAAGAMQVPGIVSADRLRASEESLRAGDPELALRLARQAVSAAPWAAGPYAQRAVARAATGDRPGYRADFDQARDHEPINWRHPLALAVLELQAGDRAAAETAYGEARALLPTLPVSGGRILRALGADSSRTEAAATLSETLIRE